MRSWIAVSAAAAGLMFLTACQSRAVEREVQAAVRPAETSPPPPAEAAKPSATPAKKKTPVAPKRVAVSDETLEKAIRARFERSKIATNRFEVTVQGGVARIDGQTETVQHKATATRLAKSAGARAVENRIVISEEARRKAAETLATGRRRKQVTRSAARDEGRPTQ
jgi:osmotically-inducible protein OsmY